jgi:RNA polymerase sigma-70 factor (ECF subfamily)
VLPDLERCNPDTEAVMERMRGCIEKHPEKDRRLIEARYFADETVISMAQRLCTTVSAISSQLYRIREQLRQCIEEGLAL